MIVLDTNVISELMRPAPEPAVISWLDRQPTASIWTTSICAFEVRLGLRLMAEGRRRRELESRFEAVLQEDLGGRVLELDTPAAFAAADLAGQNQPQGLNVDLRDLLIAGTVSARRGTLATRNVKHFQHTGIELVNPWGTDTSGTGP